MSVSNQGARMAKKTETAALSEAQLEIMNVVWDGPRGATVVEVWKTLSATTEAGSQHRADDVGSAGR